MANDINRVMLIGRLTRDPELRTTGGGTAYARFSIANNRSYTANGERREEVSYFNCVSWGRQAEIINQYCKKGKQVAIDGRLQQRSWEDKEGKKQSSVDVVVDSLQLLGAPGEGGGGGGERAAYSGSSGGGGGGGRDRAQPANDYPPGDFAEPSYSGGMDDDDIPF